MHNVTDRRRDRQTEATLTRLG